MKKRIPKVNFRKNSSLPLIFSNSIINYYHLNYFVYYYYFKDTCYQKIRYILTETTLKIYL